MKRNDNPISASIRPVQELTVRMLAGRKVREGKEEDSPVVGVEQLAKLEPVERDVV